MLIIKNLQTAYQAPKIYMFCWYIYFKRNVCIYSEGFIVTIISEVDS